MAQWQRICLPTRKTQETLVWSLGWEDPQEEEMATHSSILAWKVPWTESLQATVHDVAKSQIQLSDWACTCSKYVRVKKKATLRRSQDLPEHHPPGTLRSNPLGSSQLSSPFTGCWWGGKSSCVRPVWQLTLFSQDRTVFFRIVF